MSKGDAIEDSLCKELASPQELASRIAGLRNASQIPAQVAEMSAMVQD
jgi:hypothetical protein